MRTISDKAMATDPVKSNDSPSGPPWWVWLALGVSVIDLTITTMYHAGVIKQLKKKAKKKRKGK